MNEGERVGRAGPEGVSAFAPAADGRATCAAVLATSEGFVLAEAEGTTTRPESWMRILVTPPSFLIAPLRRTFDSVRTCFRTSSSSSQDGIDWRASRNVSRRNESSVALSRVDNALRLSMSSASKA